MSDTKDKKETGKQEDKQESKQEDKYQGNEQKEIKLIIEGICPHCSEKIFMCQKMTTPLISYILKKEDFDSAKEKVRLKIEESALLTNEQKGKVFSWLLDEGTMFGPDEVESTLENIIRTNVK